MQKSKIVYMGTPDFAVARLNILYDMGCEIGYVVTQPDRAKNRGKKIQYTPVKERALELGLNILQPEKIKDNTEFINILKEYAPDLIVVSAYGMILPKEILEIPKGKCVNIHGSLLPKWRGSAPIQRAIMSGDKETGITLMYMAEGLDTGDMIAKAKVYIEDMTSGELYPVLADLGAELLRDNLENILNGNAKKEKQNESLATYANMIFKDEAVIDFSKKPWEIYNIVRGMNPAPVSRTLYKGEMLKVWKCKVGNGKTDKENGTILDVNEEGIKVACGGEVLVLTEIQVAGKKAMKVAEFIKGNDLEIGVVLGA